MALVYLDRVWETTTVTGTGSATLLGAVTGFQSFSAVGNGNTCYYALADHGGSNWEVGIGTYSSTGPTLARTTVLSSSNSGSLVNFTAGTKDVYLTQPASKAVSKDESGYVTVNGTFGEVVSGVVYPVVSQADIGTAPNEVPVNGMLGKLAFQDVLDTVTNNPYNDTAISDVQPSLLLDFANSKTLDPRITYTRASTASYYDGKTTAVAEQNLLTYSQDYTQSTWFKVNASITANATTAPDGTSTATLLVPNTTSSVHALQINISAAANSTISFYAKAGGYSHAVVANATNNWVYFDLTSGTVESTLGSGWSSASIVNVGNGWFRCHATSSSATGSAQYIYAYNAAQSNGNSAPIFAGDGTSGIYIWGAQLEQRSAVSSYTPTTSSPITNYIPALQTAAAGVPRFDHDPVTGESKGFLIEEQRTNLLTYSSAFDNAAWTKTNVTITADTIVAPDGTLTADKLVESASNNYHYMLQNIAYNNQTLTVFAKAAERNKLWVIFNGNVSGVFNLLNGTTVSVSGATGLTSTSITYVGNGWYRCSAYYTGSGTGIGFGTSNNAITYQGDGYSGLYIWGAQLEAGSFATSYIPTTSAQVTRSADAAGMTGTNFSSWYNVSEGTVYAEALTASSTVAAIVMDFNSGSGYEPSAGIQYNEGASSNVSGFTYVNGAYQARLQSTVTPTVFNKITYAYKTNDFASSANSAAVLTDTSGVVGSGFNSFGIGCRVGLTTSQLNGPIKKLAYYPKRLSDAELMEMTE